MLALVGALFAVPNALAGLYTVNSTLDTGGVCTPSFCTLRQAITTANGDPGSTITFQFGIGGSNTISPSSPLPAIAAPTTIDATTQPGYGGAPLVELNGSGAGSSADGLTASADATIRGFSIVNFGGAGIALESGASKIEANYVGLNANGAVMQGNHVGIRVESGNNIIGGPTATARNVISGNATSGIEIGVIDNAAQIYGNYVGTDASGTFARPNQNGIVVGTDDNTIGGPAAGQRNVISGNSNDGIRIAAGNTTVRGNYIGTNAHGDTAIANVFGVDIFGSTTALANANEIGGGNVISGNASSGVFIRALQPDTARNNSVWGSLIGVAADGKTPLGNAAAGVAIAADGGDGRNAIGGNTLAEQNTIANNVKGIAIGGTGSFDNQFLINSIHDNAFNGIDLNDDGVTGNDPDDADTGANNLLNFPVLSNATRDSNGVAVADVAFDGPPGALLYRFDFYASPGCDNSGFGEGEQWIGTLLRTVDDNGDIAFNTDNGLRYAAPGSCLTATATDPSGNTSEFSQGTLIGSPAGATFTVNTTQGSATGGDCVTPATLCSLTDAINAANAAPGTDTIAFDIPCCSFQIFQSIALPTITEAVILDGTSEPGYTGSPIVQLDGGATIAGTDGIVVDLSAADGSTIRGLSITNFSGAGVSLTGPPSVLHGNYIGLTPGGVGAGNQTGISVKSDANEIGGVGAPNGNVVSGNSGDGVLVTSGVDNSIEGNRIGTSPAGTVAVPNGTGVHLLGVGSQTIGGAIAGAGNIVSGNAGHGIDVEQTTGASTIEGNLVGLAANGAVALPNNLAGIRANLADGLHIGGPTAAARNAIAGNGGTGILMFSSNDAVIEGNYLGLDQTGNAPLPNSSEQIVLSDSSGVRVGGTSSGERNVIVGNASGNTIVLNGTNTFGTVFQGNYVGLTAAGQAAPGNAQGIVIVSGPHDNTIGGVVAGAGNVLDGSAGAAVFLAGAGSGNKILGNNIGTDTSGSATGAGLGNAVGIDVVGTNNTLIGSTSPGGGNVIAGSADAGIVFESGSQSNTVIGNFIGADRQQTANLGNDQGIRFDANGGGDSNQIGPENVIANSTNEGIQVAAGAGNRISANSIYANGGKGIRLTGGNNGQAAPVLTNAKKSTGTSITGTLTSAPNTSYFVEYFMTPTCGAQPQGRFYLGFQTATTDAGGQASLSFGSSVPQVDQGVTATVTSQATKDTSEFSACLTVTPSNEIVVNTTADHDDGGCTAIDCTLREAILLANDALGGRTIVFDLPGSAPFVIQPTSPLPTISNLTLIDGTTQPGFVSDPLVVVDGTNAGSDLLVFGPGSDGSGIRGLVVNNWGTHDGIVLQSSQDTIEHSYIGTTTDGFAAAVGTTGFTVPGPAIHVESSNNVIGGGAGERNVIVSGPSFGSGNAGVLIDGNFGGANNNTVSANYIGLDKNGVHGLGGSVGVQTLDAAGSNVIGGATPASANVIAGVFNGIILGSASDARAPGSGSNIVQSNILGLQADGTSQLTDLGTTGINDDAIDVWDTGSNIISDNVVARSFQGIFLIHSDFNIVSRNNIGTDITGTLDRGNTDVGVAINQGITNMIGDGNLIAFNSGGGIVLTGNANSNTIANNDVGTDASGTQDMHNGTSFSAIEVNGDSSGNIVGPGNLVKFSQKPGVTVTGAATLGNRITQNDIDANSGLGIDLGNDGVTPNDSGDGDSGPNDFQNWPVISSATQTQLDATLDTAPGTYRIEVFTSPTCDPSGNGEGETFVTSANIDFGVPNQAFTITLGSPLPLGTKVTMTASSSTANTSEFSNCFAVTPPSGLVAGSVVASTDPPASQNVDLTSAGTTDWAVWGYAAGGTSTSLAPDVRKAGGSGISDLTNIDPAPSVNLRGIGQFVEPITFSWADGTGPATATNAQTGLQHDGQTQALSTLNHGFAFDVPADTSQRTVKVYVITNRAAGRLTASISDGSAPTYVNTLPAATNTRTGVYTITYSALSSGQTLHVQWVESADNCAAFHCDNAAIFAVALGSPNTLVVTNPADTDGTTCAAGCTLRQAINAANLNPGSTIVFNLPSGSTTIAPATNLPAITAPTTIDATTQPGFSGSPLVTLDGANASGNGNGFHIAANGATIRGFVITDWTNDGILVDSTDGNTIAGNYVGMNAGGINAQNSHDGIELAGDADNNTIGGTSPDDRNVISANGAYGVEIGTGGAGSSDNNVVRGNYIGLQPGGTGSPGVTGNHLGGILVAGDHNTIGGTTPAAGNFVSANIGFGVKLEGAGNVVKGNVVGLDASDDNPTANSTDGIEVQPFVSDQEPNVIGDTTGGGNVISANSGDGIYLAQIDANPGTVIQGNLIGTDPSGSLARGNGLNGIHANDAAFTLIDQNVISGNLGAASSQGNGIRLFGFDSHDNVITSNKIGTDGTGATPLGNEGVGVYLDESSGLVSGNLISGNLGAGVRIGGPEPPGTHSTVTGNLIGTNAGGTSAVGNATGVSVAGSSDDLIGGTGSGSGNVISGNIGAGVDIANAGGTTVLGNTIGLNAGGTGALANAIGVRIASSAAGSTIGTTSPGAPNVISGNANGVVIDGAATTGNVIEGNFVGTGTGGTGSFGNGSIGVQLVSGATSNIVRRNTIRNNGGSGVRIPQPLLHNNVTANSIDSNGGLGIDVAGPGITPNDSEADGFQNFPTITTVGTTTVSGSLASTANTTFNVDVFRSPTCDGSGNGEGRTYLGSTTVTTNNLGSGGFTANVAALPVGQVVTATAIGPNGDTSEFSACKATVPPPIAANLSLAPATTSTPAGAPRVKLSDVPPSVLLASQSTSQTAPINDTPINDTPINDLPINDLPINDLPINDLGFDTLSGSVPALGSIALSSIPLLRTGGWPAALAGTPLATLPLQNVTLRDYYALPASVNPETRTTPAPIAPITLADLDLSHSALGSLPASAIILANVQLSYLRSLDTWCRVFGPTYCSSSASLAGETVMTAALTGAPINDTPINDTPINDLPINDVPINDTPSNEAPINDLPINDTPINDLPINDTPINDTPINDLPINDIMVANSTLSNSPINDLPINDLATPNAVLFCAAQNPTAANTVDCTNATLKQAFDAHAIRPNTTFGDLRNAAGPSPNVFDSIALGDLHFFGDVTLKGLVDSLPPDTMTLGEYFLLLLHSPTASQGLGWERLNISGSAIEQYSTGGSTVGYRAQFNVQANGGPTGVPSPVTVNATLGDGFFYVPGSSKLVSSGTSCATAAPAIADPTETTLNDGRVRLTFTVNTTVGNGYAVCFTARPGIELGPQPASLDATPSGSTTASAIGTTLDVGDTLEANNDATTAPQVFSDSFYLSYLTSASDVDYYRFLAPPIGTVVTIHLSHLPTDYDLVAYGPPETQLRPSITSAVPLDSPPLTDGGFDLTHATDTLPSQTLDDLRLQTSLPMVGVSASRGTDPEDIVFVSQGGTGFYTIQVTGYNGATSSNPYMLRVQTQAPRQTATFTPRTVTGTAGPALPTLPTGLNTVFVVNRRQLEGLYGSAGATDVMTALSNDSALFTSLGYPNVTLSVDNATNDTGGAVATAYGAWNARPGDPTAANGVVRAINAMVDSKIRSQPNGANLKYIVLVGGDQAIPFARLDDFTVAAGNETGYAANFPSTSDLFASLNAGQMLSDDPYGDTNPVPYLTRQLYIPELSVGRLVESPADIVRTLNNFVSTAVGGHLDPTTSLTTGYDFLNDGAVQVNTAFSRFGSGARPLFDDPTVSTDGWTLDDLKGAFLPTTGAAPSITSLNGHASHYQFAPPNLITGARSPLLTTADVTASNASLANRLIFSMGCHAGLSVADSIVTAGRLDWPQAFAQKGAGAYLGNTGFGFGDSLVVAYSEELSKLLAQRVAAGGSVGDALAAAKQAYYGELGVFGVYDEKAMAEFTLYGLPMWRVTGPAGTGGAAAPQTLAAADSASSAQVQTAATTTAATTTASASTQSVVTDPATGLDTETFSADPTNTPHTTGQGTYWSGPDGVQVEHLRPIQPKAFVALGGTTGHGALITELTSGDQECVNPVYARPVLDLTGTEGEIPFGDAAFPSKLQALRTFLTPTGLQQRLVLMTGQFFTHACSSNSDPQVGVQRLFSHIAGRVYRSTSTDYAPPAYQLIQSSAVGGNAAFTIDVTDTTPSTDSVKQVVVAVRSGAQTAWTFVNLTKSATNAARWTGGAPVSDVNHYEYFVQAVDANGNVAVSTNKGFYFAGEIVQQPTGTLQAGLSGTKVSGWFTGTATLSASEPQGVTLQASVDGGPFGPVPPSITGDGVHTIDLRASNGDTGTLIAAIDTLAPTTTLNAPVSGAQYVRDSTVKADYFCSDSGSGLASGCVGTVPSGTPIDTACASATCTKTFTVTAPKDVVNHTGTAKTITYTVVERRKILFSSARTTSGDIYAMNPDGSGVVQLTSTAGNDEQPAWSPDGSRIAFASARSGSNGLDIYVMNADGSSVRRLTTAAGDDTAPTWSPDGNRIAFQSLRDGNTEIYVMNNDGTGQTRLTNDTHQDNEPAWAPDGTRIAWVSNRMIAFNIWTMKPDGTGLVQLTSMKQPEVDPAWSPDSSKILFSSNRAGVGTSFDLFTMNSTNGSSVVRLTSAANDDTEPAYSRDGRKIVFMSTRLSTSNADIFVANPDGSGATRVTTYSGADRNPDW